MPAPSSLPSSGNKANAQLPIPSPQRCDSPPALPESAQPEFAPLHHSSVVPETPVLPWPSQGNISRVPPTSLPDPPHSPQQPATGTQHSPKAAATLSPIRACPGFDAPVLPDAETPDPSSSSPHLGHDHERSTCVQQQQLLQSKSETRLPGLEQDRLSTFRETVHAAAEQAAVSHGAAPVQGADSARRASPIGNCSISDNSFDFLKPSSSGCHTASRQPQLCAAELGSWRPAVALSSDQPTSNGGPVPVHAPAKLAQVLPITSNASRSMHSCYAHVHLAQC